MTESAEEVAREGDGTGILVCDPHAGFIDLFTVVLRVFPTLHRRFLVLVPVITSMPRLRGSLKVNFKDPLKRNTLTF